MISCTLILSHVICALCVLMKRTNRKKSREHLHWIMFANIYRILAENICFRAANFFLMFYWIAYWYPIVVNVLLHVFVFGSMLFFFSSFVVRYIFSQYRKSASKFFFVCVFVCENQGCLEANTLKLNTYVKKEYQSCKHGKYAQQSEHYGERILEFIEFWL